MLKLQFSKNYSQSNCNYLGESMLNHNYYFIIPDKLLTLLLQIVEKFVKIPQRFKTADFIERVEI